MTRDDALALRQEWLQKHPTPSGRAGEFHWHPAHGDGALRARCVERLHGIDGPAALWELDSGRVTWARTFAAIDPHDGRRYVGLVIASAADAGSPPAELLSAVPCSPSRPWGEPDDRDGDDRDGDDRGGDDRGGDDREGDDGDDRNGGDRSAARGNARATERNRFVADAAAISDVQARAIARALVAGGTAWLADPIDPSVPPVVASLERWMPDSVWRVARQGVVLAGDPPVDPDDIVARLVVAAWRRPTSSAAVGWRLLCDLARTTGASLGEVGARVESSAASASVVLTERERERGRVIGRDGLTEVLHAWGRGRFDHAAAEDLVDRLADLVGLRVIAAIAGGDDPRAVLAEVRWYAILPAGRRAELLDAAIRRSHALRELFDRDDASAHA